MVQFTDFKILIYRYIYLQYDNIYVDKANLKKKKEFVSGQFVFVLSFLLLFKLKVH